MKTLSQSPHAKIEVPPPNAAIDPGDGFYEHVNGTWLRQTHLPAYTATFGLGDEIESLLDARLRDLASEGAEVALRGEAPTDLRVAALDAVGRLVLSAMRPEKQRFSVELAKRGLRSYTCLGTQEDVARGLGKLMRYGVPTVLKILVEPHLGTGRRGEATYGISIEAGSLGLPDPRYYLATELTSSSAKLLQKYADLLDFVSREFDLGFNLSNGISVETELAKPLFQLSEEEEPIFLALGPLERKFKHIPWRPLLEAIGISKEDCEGRKFHIHSPKWLEVVDATFERLPIEQWLLLISIHASLHALPYLPAPFDTRHYDFFGKELLGLGRKVPQSVLTMNILKTTLSDVLSYLFVDRYIAPEQKRAAETLVDRIVKSAKARLRETTWLEPAARDKAVAKLNSMRRCIFYAEPVAAPPGLPYLQTDTLLANIYLSNEARMDRLIGRLKTQPDLERMWDEPAFTVNAYYYTDLNQLVVPAGSFAWPFYDPKRLGWNYGGIGAVIAHEIVHAFDEDGKELDANGEERPMWSKRDDEEFQRRVDAIVRLYGQAKVGGLFVNGKLTASENLADLGGLAIALDALKAEFTRAALSDEARRKELREFFTSYAVSWRTKERSKKAVQGLFLDKHAPPRFRVNLVVAQFAEWYEAFDVRTDHDLYIPPEERIEIF